MPKDRFEVSPSHSYLESLETVIYKFSYIYKEKSNDISYKNVCVVEIVQVPKIKNDNINPITLFDHILKNNISVKGVEKRIFIRIVNSVYNTDLISNTAILSFDKFQYMRKSRFLLPGLRRENIEDVNDPKILADLVKENVVYASGVNNKQKKDEVENVILVCIILIENPEYLQKDHTLSKIPQIFQD